MSMNREQYQQSSAPGGYGHGIGASGAPIGQQSHYGEGGNTMSSCTCNRPGGQCICQQQRTSNTSGGQCNCGMPGGVCTCGGQQQQHGTYGAVPATGGQFSHHGPMTGIPPTTEKPSRMQELTGRVEHAAGVLTGNQALKEKGQVKQQGEATHLQNQSLNEARRLEQDAMQHREHAVTAGAHPENRHLGGVSGGY